MSDRSLKKSQAGKSNRPGADENLVLFSVNRGTSLDGIIYDRFIDLSSAHAVLLKPGREQAKVAKPGADDEKKHGNDQLSSIPEVPLGALSRLVLGARNATSKLRSISATRAGSRSENDSSSRPTRSGSIIRPSNIPTVRSSSVPKKTTTASALASVSSPKRTVSRSLTPVSRKSSSPSLTPVSRKIPSSSLTPSRISTATSTALSFKKSGDVQRSRSLSTPRSKPQIAANSAQLSSRTNVRSASASSRGCVRRDGCTSGSATPRTPPRLKETVTLAFGRPVGTTGNVNSPKRNTSPDVTRTRPKGHSTSLIPTFSGVSHGATPKSVKPSVTVADSMRSGKKLSKASAQMAINQLDVARNGKVGTHAFSSTMLYPHSIRSSSSGLRNMCGSNEGSCSSNQEEEEGRSLTKERGDTENKNDSARYEALLNVKDVKDTNWLLNIDDESHHSLIFDNAFDSPPDLFPPL